MPRGQYGTFASSSTASSDSLQINAIVGNTDKRERDRQQELEAYIRTRELELGSQFVLAKPEDEALLLTCDGQLLSFDGQGIAIATYLHYSYGLNPAEKWARLAFNAIRTSCLTGVPRQARRFAMFDRTSCTLYMSRWNGSIRVLDGTTVVSEPNGYSALFLDDDSGSDVAEPEIGPHGELLPALVDLCYADNSIGGILPEQQQMALTTWLFCLAFPDLIASKPLLLLEGAPGSGKSTAARKIQQVVHGNINPIMISKDGERDFPVQLLANPITVLDNTDNYIEWIPDAVCSYVTGGGWDRRKLYSDKAVVKMRPQSFIAVASKDPASFRREDTAERLIVLRLAKREVGTSLPDNVLHERLAALRPRLFGEYLFYCNKIVDLIRAGAWEEEAETAADWNRMGDYAQMAFLVGRVLDWDRTEIEDMLQALKAESEALANENDPLIDLLTIYLRWPHRVGRPKSVTDLYADLNQLAQENQKTFYRSARMLSQKLRSEHLKTHFIVQEGAADGHKTFALWPKSPKGLTALPGGKTVDRAAEEKKEQAKREGLYIEIGDL